MSLATKKNMLRRLLTRCSRLRSGRKVVASFTSYPQRIQYAERVVREMFAQKTLPDLTVLYLSKDQFPNRETDLPTGLLSCRSFDFEIRWVDGDMKSHKKYLYAFKDFPEALIVTLDDDIEYRHTLIEELIASYEKYPHCISAIRTHAITFDENGKMRPYGDWLMENGVNRPDLCGKPSNQSFGTSGAGMLFPPNSLPALAFDEEVIRATSLNADDIWLKAMTALNGYPTVAVPGWAGVDCIEGSQESSLWATNQSGGNDAVLTKLRAYFKSQEALPSLDELLFDEEFNALL